MKSKIAIVGDPKSAKLLLARGISHVTTIPFLAHKTLYEQFRTFQADYFNDQLEWQKMFLIASTDFIERIENENQNQQFISDGAAFSTLMYLKLQKKFPVCRAQQEKDKLLGALQNVCFDYAAKHYELIVHIDSGMADECYPYIEMYEKYHIPYKIYENEDIESLLPKVIYNLELPVKSAIDKTIFHLKDNLFY